MLGYVRRSTLNIKDITVRRRLYLCLVRSQLCYGSQIWAPQSVTLIKRVERLQRSATKYILNLPFRCDTTYNQRLILLDLLPLCYWHEFLDMATFYKLTNDMTIDNNLIQSSPNNNKRETRSSNPNSQSSVNHNGTMQDHYLPKVISQPNKEIMERTTKKFDKQ